MVLVHDEQQSVFVGEAVDKVPVLQALWSLKKLLLVAQFAKGIQTCPLFVGECA